MELCVKNISKKYGKTVALQDFNMNFTNGVYALLGPNGSGKSTLMNIIAGVLAPTTGKVIYNGENIEQAGKRYYRDFGFLPQVNGFYKNFTAREFLKYMAVIKGIDNKKEVNERVNKMLELVNLSEAADKKIGGFSGGMKQRVGIAQALLNDPKIIILDEPTAGLDPQERIRLKNLIAKIAFDKVVIIATHIVSDVESIAKEIILLKKGEIVLNDTVNKGIRQVENHVFLLEVKQEEVSDLMNKYKVGNINNIDGKIFLRIIDDEKPENAITTAPNLEDLYLYYFGEV